MIQFSVAIQAGGQSSRMGSDKGLLPFQGTMLIQYILDQVKGYGDETFIISNLTEEYTRFGLPVHRDVMSGYGALGGIYSAIWHAKHELCIILACDMPFVNIPLMDYLLSLVMEHDAVVPRLDAQEYAEPFRAVYHKSCLPVIKSMLEAKELKVSNFLEDVDVRFVEMAELVRFDPQLHSFFNINTPADLTKAEKIAS